MKQESWHVSLDVIGPIRENSAYKTIKDNPCVRYIPKQPKEELLNYYRNADIFVMPSHHETFGLVYAEAMSQSLPVIYTKEQGFDGQFPDGSVGYTISSTAYFELKKRIEISVFQYKELSTVALESVPKFKWILICDNY